MKFEDAALDAHIGIERRKRVLTGDDGDGAKRFNGALENVFSGASFRGTGFDEMSKNVDDGSGFMRKVGGFEFVDADGEIGGRNAARLDVAFSGGEFKQRDGVFEDGIGEFEDGGLPFAGLRPELNGHIAQRKYFKSGRGERSGDGESEERKNLELIVSVDPSISVAVRLEHIEQIDIATGVDDVTVVIDWVNKRTVKAPPRLRKGSNDGDIVAIDGDEITEERNHIASIDGGDIEPELT